MVSLYVNDKKVLIKSGSMSTQRLCVDLFCRHNRTEVILICCCKDEVFFLITKK
jgi:hypothetical protein